MKKYMVILLIVFSKIALADVPAEQINEVEHLLDFVKHSHCTINRNGRDYNAEKALEHIKNKYNYFRDDIKSTEDFIKLSATKSTMSGKYYIVRCTDNKIIKTMDWLLAELKRYRAR